MSPEQKVKILYVEDDETIAFLTKDNLQMKGYEVVHAKDGLEALEYFRRDKFRLCIIDIMLPHMDGYTLAKAIRKEDADVPVLFLSAKSLPEDKIKGLSLGGDDYITKPFSVDELALRIGVFLKRSRVYGGQNKERFTIGNVQYHYDEQIIIVNNKKIDLTQRENELMKFLFENCNRVIRREEILKTVWGDDDYFLGRSLDVFISRIRKIFASGTSISIRNIHGVGYRFNTD